MFKHECSFKRNYNKWEACVNNTTVSLLGHHGVLAKRCWCSGNTLGEVYDILGEDCETLGAFGNVLGELCKTLGGYYKTLRGVCKEMGGVCKEM